MTELISPDEYEIHVDLDGVLVDFQSTAFAIAGLRPTDDPSDKALRRDFWKKIEQHVRKGGKFFEVMKPLPDAFVLWDYIKHRKPRICSATGHIIGAAQEKRDWVRVHLGHETANSANFVRDGRLKAQFAHAKAILIDDRKKVLVPWIEAGGIGILHTSADRTIAQLKEMGL